MSGSVFDAVVLLAADGLVAVGRVLGGLRRRSGWERQARAVDALNALEDSQDGLEPGQLTAAQQAAVDLGLSLADRAVAYGDQICAAYVDAFKPPPEFAAQRSAAVTVPAADNTPDCGCGSGTKCPDPITCPAAVTAAMDEDTAAADGTALYDAIVALFDYHDITRNLTADYLWRCGGCNWKGNQRREHTLHRLALVADMKNAIHRVQEQLGGAS